MIARISKFFKRILCGSEIETQNQKQANNNIKKKLDNCQICFNDYNDKNICCEKCQICSTCLDSWFSQQIKDQIGDPMSNLDNIKISCPACLNVISIHLLKKNQKIFNKSVDTLTDFSLKKDDSYIACPSSTCRNIGWVNDKQCRKDFTCSVCNYQWENPNKISFSRMIRLFFSKDIKSRLFKFLFTKNCPYCNTCIQKNGGCKHMTCGKCKKQFCWNCKLSIHGTANVFCLFISIIKAFIILLPLNLVLYYLNTYDYLFSSIMNCFSLNYLLFQFGIFKILYFFFRCIYQLCIIPIYFIMGSHNRRFLGAVLLIIDLYLWYQLTRWIEIFYALLIFFQGWIFLLQ